MKLRIRVLIEQEIERRVYDGHPMLVIDFPIDNEKQRGVLEVLRPHCEWPHNPELNCWQEVPIEL